MIKQGVPLFFALLGSLLLAACGGGNGDNNGDDGGGNDNSSTEAVVFQLNSALFASTPEGGTPIALSPMSNTAGRVGQYVLSPDKKWVAYLADAQTDQLYELYLSSVDGTDVAKKLSPAIVNSTRTIDNIVWSPDSTQLAYVADQEIVRTWELYVSTINGAIGVKVSADPRAGREGNTDVIRRGDTGASRTSDVVQWAPDGSRLAYIADWDTNQVFELYTTTPDGNTNVVRVSGAMVASGGDGGDIPWADKRRSFAWAPDSSLIAYRADQEVDGIFHLYVADPAVQASPDKVSPNVSDGRVRAFEWAPDSSRLAYTYTEPTSGDTRLFRHLLGSAVSTIPLSPEGGPNQFAGAGDIAYFSWAPDSSRIAYVADLRINERYELFTILPDSTLSNVRVSGGNNNYDGLESNGSVAFYWSPDSQYIAYLSYQQYENRRGLYASTANGDSNVKLSGSVSSSKGINIYQWSPDSSHVAYVANQNNADYGELFASPIAGARETSDAGGGPASNPRLNPELVQDGEVFDTFIQWSADSQRVMYYADQDVDGAVAFYSSTRDGNSNNIKISRFSFATQIYPRLSSNCGGCHTSSTETGNFYWYKNTASDTYDAMNTAGHFDNNYIVEKLDGTQSHVGGTNDTLATLFAIWIGEGANNN